MKKASFDKNDSINNFEQEMDDIILTYELQRDHSLPKEEFDKLSQK